ncbi:MAG: 2-hydroxychromene-2-carboxylate isomerase [Kangiellaceae bacterium]|nr:2-hydroxychromene-2-carboxylate isomerase [Kangiellaceae bacterium]
MLKAYKPNKAIKHRATYGCAGEVAMRKLEFYFDYLSPYAYFAWNKVEKLCSSHSIELIIKPIVFGKLLDHWGQLGPAEIPPKREWLIKYCLYYAQQNELPLLFPKKHPFNSLTALRVSLKEVSGAYQSKLVSAIFNSGWGKGADIGYNHVISEIIRNVGLDPQEVIDRVTKDETKLLLKESTNEAISKGVFGIPTIIYGEELFWGNDQFEYLSQIIKGKYKANNKLVRDIISKPSAIDRQR